VNGRKRGKWKGGNEWEGKGEKGNERPRLHILSRDPEFPVTALLRVEICQEFSSSK